jgi:outer membrane protein OmpA-like peptidoglycan-associated protein
MKKLIILIYIVFTSAQLTVAQDFLPFASSNYAGVTGLQLQPASIADSRYGFDLTLAGMNFSFTNNFYSFDPDALLNPNKIKDFDFRDDQYILRNEDGSLKSGTLNFRMDAMSFMLSISDKAAIGFTPSVRGILNIDKMTENVAILLDHLNQEPNLWDIRLNNENINAQLNLWNEFGFTYARVLMDREKHFLKAGATLKLNQGLGAAYMFMKDLNYEVNDADTVSFYNTYTHYGASDNLNANAKYQFETRPSLSFDFGFVYEYRPDFEKFRYDMDGKTNLWRSDQEKYLFRLGFSMTDIGSVKYRRNPLSKDFQADIRNLFLGDITLSENFIDEINHVIDSNFTYHEVPEKFTMTLPVSMSLQADVRLARNLYLNVTPYLALNRGISSVHKVHYVTALNIIPRYDWKYFGVSVPVQYNTYKQWNVGMGVRLGALWFGMNDIISLLASSKNRYGANFSVLFKMPVLYGKPRDRDNDHISNRMDHCPDIAGIAELKGCPDADLDGITDALDKCPKVAGLPELNGCPDADGDGITDADDQCPAMKGTLQFNGCPDSDGDSIIDPQDNCPFNAGSLSMNGCPDQDNDGIADKDDNCPTVAGTRENKGCPFLDTDGDGVKDEADRCPALKGELDNYGCPYQDTDHDSIPDKDDDCPSIPGTSLFRGCPDTDGDGISDKNDHCPAIAGVPENNGCPAIKKEEKEILDQAFSNLEFESGKSVIKQASLASLNNLADLMKKRTEFKLLLAGHTDNVGKPEANLTLSKNRTLAVKNYLITKGIAAGRIKTEWFGQNMPVASNATPEGRQKNRRVEMSIIFE